MKSMKNILNLLSSDKLQKKSENEQIWDNVEIFYSKLLIDFSHQKEIITSIKTLIKDIRSSGFDKTLCIGISLWFIRIYKPMSNEFSDKTLYFEWSDGGIQISKKDKIIFKSVECKYCNEIEILLRELEQS